LCHLQDERALREEKSGVERREIACGGQGVTSPLRSLFGELLAVLWFRVLGRFAQDTLKTGFRAYIRSMMIGFWWSEEDEGMADRTNHSLALVDRPAFPDRPIKAHRSRQEGGSNLGSALEAGFGVYDPAKARAMEVMNIHQEIGQAHEGNQGEHFDHHHDSGC
jgi:hypothetical protein